MPPQPSPSKRDLEELTVNHHWKWLAGLLCLLLIGGGTWLWCRHNSDPEESEWVWPETPKVPPPLPAGPPRPPKDVTPPKDLTRLKIPHPPTDGPPPLKDLKVPPPPLRKDAKLPGRP
jgi:hypothetical protein